MRISDWSSDVCSSDLVTSPPATGMTGKVSGPRLGGLVLQHLGLLARGDGDAPRPLGLGDLAHQLDGEQAVLELRTGHLDVVGKVEAPLEGTGGDAAMEILHPVLLGVLLGTLFRLRLAAGDDEAVLLRGDVEFALTEPGDRHHDAIGVLDRKSTRLNSSH